MFNSIGLPDLVFDAHERFCCRVFSQVGVYKLLSVMCVTCISDRNHETDGKPDQQQTSSQPKKNVSATVHTFSHK